MSRKRTKQGRKRKPTGPKPFWEKPEKINALEAAFSNDATIIQACVAAKIGESSYYDFKKKNPAKCLRWESASEVNKLKAKSNILAKIHDDDDIELSKWYLDRRDQDFIPKTKQQMADAEGKNLKLQSVVVPIEVTPPEYAEPDAKDNAPAPAKAA